MLDGVILFGLRMGLDDEIRNLLGRGDELGKLELDVIRVLTVFNGVSWMTEIISDIVKIHGYALDYVPTDELLDRALSELESKGIISVESRRRGKFLSRGVYEDKLIRIKDLRAAKKALAGDEVYKDYLSRQIEMIRRAVKGSKDEMLG